MDFSRLHMYTPPQCVPENTGYTYALSSSYSSDALDFETEHKLDPVFDSPRMSRRSLRVVTTQTTGDGQAVDAHSCIGSAVSLKDSMIRTAKQRRSANKLALSINHVSRKVTSSAVSQGGALSLQNAAFQRPPVLDESLIREQTKVDHFWGLDDDGDLKAGSKASTQENGEVATTAATVHNGYTCRDCSMLAERRDALTASTSVRGPLTRIYSRERNQKPDPSYCGRMHGRELLREDGQLAVHRAALCDDYKEKQRLETHTATPPPSPWPPAWARLLGPICACAGSFLRQSLRRIGAAGWLVSRTAWLVLWLALAAPGKAASGMFWWLGVGWYQFVTLVSWLNVFLLTRCLRNICKFLILLIPLFLVLVGLSLQGQGDLLSFLPVLNWPDVHRTQGTGDPKDILQPETPLQGGEGALPWYRMSDMEQQLASLSGRCHHQDEKLRELTILLQTLQARVDQMDDGSAGLVALVRDAVGQHLREVDTAGLQGTEADFMTVHHEHEVRISHLEGVLEKLTEKSEAIQKELEQTKQKTLSGAGGQQLLATVKHLEQELERLRSELASWRHVKTGCEAAGAIYEKVDAQVRETVRLLFSEDQPGGSLEWLLQKFSSQFVSKEDLQATLRGLELQILRNLSHHVSVMKQAPPAEAVVSAVKEAGISGITEAQAHAIVNNALRLYSQDKTGMVDFALESGGGSILSTRCSETYETKTALISLFGIPLWYFSQSPRVVIQPDIYPGNCWAFKGSQGYLVVRLSMTIHPTAFTLEHIPKTLSPTGNITSAPKDFAVYGLENEYQEEGQLLGQFMYDQDGESLQMFQALFALTSEIFSQNSY
ncbi:SUN domain-containing protein 1 [Carlito syrichta]|uniref:SUN domain-containing protein 1 n=1 Tax=Carlito syrichta TaxID=1868482 RepID=A0A3Q0DNH4_CARSF|nr:SUN domain-containing protein 1 [Carlito syrichta]